MRKQPLFQFHPHLSLYCCGLSAGPDASDQIQPILVSLIKIASIRLGHQCFRVERQKEIGWIAAKRITKEAGWSDSHDGEWRVIYVEDTTNDGRIRSVLLP